jgi:protein ImuA
MPTGFTALDAELPGGGWPVRVLTELLLPQPGLGEVRLLAPLLRALAIAGRSVMLFNPPAMLNAPALWELGCPPAACIVVHAKERPAARRRPGRSPGTPAGAELGWAIEQALRSGQLGAVLAWPGQVLRAEALRRLQLAAQAHEGPAFLLREAAVAAQASPAPLRLALGVAGPDELAVQILKRRGPAQAQPLRLALAPVLSERARNFALAMQPQPAMANPGPGPRAPGPPGAPPGEAGLAPTGAPLRPPGPAGAGGVAALPRLPLPSRVGATSLVGAGATSLVGADATSLVGADATSLVGAVGGTAAPRA